jgi:ABC-2 type transport system permease protein
MTNVRWQCRAAAILLRGAFRGVAEYRADLLLTLLAGALYQGTGFLTVWVVLDRFDALAGWTLRDMTLLYGVRMFAHALWVVPFSQLAFLSEHIRQGTFDRFLLRPVNPLIQLMTTRVRLNTIGDLLGGITMLTAGLLVAHVDWNAGKIGFLIVALLGGAALECGIQLAMSSVSFRAVKADEARFVTDWIFSLYGNYPTKIFGPVGQWVLATVAPVAFVAYLPCAVLLDKADDQGLPPALAFGSPLIGALVAIAGYRIWTHQLRNYQSAGG